VAAERFRKDMLLNFGPRDLLAIEVSYEGTLNTVNNLCLASAMADLLCLFPFFAYFACVSTRERVANCC